MLDVLFCNKKRACDNHEQVYEEPQVQNEEQPVVRDEDQRLESLEDAPSERSTDNCPQVANFMKERGYEDDRRFIKVLKIVNRNEIQMEEQKGNSIQQQPRNDQQIVSNAQNDLRPSLKKPRAAP